MRVVVLHPLQVDSVHLDRVLGGQVLRMQVVRHDLWLDMEQPAEMLDTLGEDRS